MDNLTRQVTEFECFIILEVDVEGILEHGGIIVTIDRRKGLLNLADPLTDADCYITAELLFQVLSCCEMIGMGMGFPVVCLIESHKEAKVHAYKIFFTLRPFSSI